MCSGKADRMVEALKGHSSLRISTRSLELRGIEDKLKYFGDLYNSTNYKTEQ